jgi:transcriptional regulator with XRE-family HTH domain
VFLFWLFRTTPRVKDKALQRTQENIGKKLVELRLSKGYTSHESFALDYELPRVHYWRIEKGKINLTLKTLCKILDIHGLTVEEFFHQMRQENKKQ